VKTFINVCSHPSVQSGALSAPSESVETQDKDGSLSLVYDVCCDSELMAEISEGAKDRQDAVSSRASRPPVSLSLS
jgi:hypothetical protein